MLWLLKNALVQITIQGVEVGNVFGVVEVKHSTEPQDRADQSQYHDTSMQQHPGQFILPPGEGKAVQHRAYSYRTKMKKLT